jgi:hypothetical protein
MDIHVLTGVLPVPSVTRTARRTAAESVFKAVIFDHSVSAVMKDGQKSSPRLAT